MADIHGFNDIEANNGNNNRGNNNGYRLMMNNNNNGERMNVFGSFDSQGDPRKESFCAFLKNFLFPQFTLYSFTFVIIVILSLAYIITLCFGLDKKSLYFLPPSHDTLQTGCLSSLHLKSSFTQTYRWISHGFYHAYLLHILSNCFGLLIFGALTEKLLGTLKYTIIYFASGLLGSLFSMIVHPSANSVGASISVYGIFGGYFAFCILNWKLLDRLFGPVGKCFMFYFLFFFVILTVVYGLMEDKTNINVFGHLGGLLFGFLFTCSICPPDNEENCAICKYFLWRYISIGICSLFALIGFLCFYLIK